MTHHTTDVRPEREPSILFAPKIYFTEQEVDEFFQISYETLDGEEVTVC